MNLFALQREELVLQKTLLKYFSNVPLLSHLLN